MALYPNEDKIVEDYKKKADKLSLPDWLKAFGSDEVSRICSIAGEVRCQMARHNEAFLDMSNEQFLASVVNTSGIKGTNILGYTISDILPTGITSRIGITSRQKLEAKLAELKQDSQAIEDRVMPELYAACAGLNFDSALSARLPGTMGRYSKEELRRLPEEHRLRSTDWHVPRKVMISEFKDRFREEIRLANTLFPQGGYQQFLRAVVTVHDREIRDGTIDRGEEFHVAVRQELQGQQLAMIRAESERKAAQERQAAANRLAEQRRIEAAKRQAEQAEAARLAALQPPPPPLVIVPQPVPPVDTNLQTAGPVTVTQPQPVQTNIPAQSTDINAALLAEIVSLRAKIAELRKVIEAATGGQTVTTANRPTEVPGPSQRFTVADVSNNPDMQRLFASTPDTPRIPTTPQRIS